MGLDMYLYATKYVGNWNHTPEKEKQEYGRIAGALGIAGDDLAHLDGQQTVELKLKVAYWRKANAIHKWFVDNCQEGEDNCRDSEVSREQLVELVSLCQQVLGTVETVPGDIHTGTSFHADGTIVHETKPGQVVAQKQLVADLLPTQGGFFFGGTDYDEYYLADLRDTVEQLNKVLENPKFAEGTGWYFCYCSSW